MGYSRDRTFLGYLKRFQLRFLLVMVVFLYVVVPLLVWLNPSIVNIFIFGNYFVLPFSDLSHPSSYGLHDARHLQIDSDDGLQLGIWQLLPASLSGQPFEQALASGKEIILYLHGKGQNRGSKIRVGTYKALTRMGYHVVTFDYRGYGDSTGFPTEDGLMADALTVYNWVKRQCQSSPVFIWGHSLGTGVATKLARHLSLEGTPALGVVLQNPFTNVQSVMDYSKMAMPYRFLPWYMPYFKRSLKSTGTSFSSDVYICEVTSPVLIIHAKDDRVIPIELAYKLFETAQKTPARTNIVTEMVVMDGCGHNNAYMDPDFSTIVTKFTSSLLQNKKTV
ncbi:lysophosphatidylserine lipase ABHD12-like [Haliotis cracherodii]|uniref:lysophosphatidylserine lipase ABHD12-like n=1 Tax=Haliotis cracherodii TaxID=6455 RepID=UPI0039E7CC03